MANIFEKIEKDNNDFINRFAKELIRKTEDENEKIKLFKISEKQNGKKK